KDLLVPARGSSDQIKREAIPLFSAKKSYFIFTFNSIFLPFIPSISVLISQFVSRSVVVFILRRKMEAAMGLMRRMPPKHSETALSALLTLLPHHSSDLLSQVDQPLQVLCDVDNGKEFILCEYNRDADSYRSPWSNKYHPPLEDGAMPSIELRKLEIEANETAALTNDWSDGSKTGHGRRGFLQEGAWDAIHVIEVRLEDEGTASYCLTSTVMLSLTTDNNAAGTFSLSGSIRRQMKMKLSVAEGHLCNMGRMIEEMESKLRNSLDQVYFGKTKEMVCTLRPPSEVLHMKLPDK
uniref:F-actin-capping protein subunit beta n=1 Tax=Cucumis melo TaxID=3656 RepID=A0A9I9DK39_CUCME